MSTQEQFFERLYKYLETQAVAVDQLIELTTQWTQHHALDPAVDPYDVFEQLAGLPEVRLIHRDEAMPLSDEPEFVDALSVPRDNFGRGGYPPHPDGSKLEARMYPTWTHFAFTRAQAWDVYGSQKWTTRGGGEPTGPRQEALAKERPADWEPATWPRIAEVDSKDLRSPYSIEHLFWCHLDEADAGRPHKLQWPTHVDETLSDLADDLGADAETIRAALIRFADTDRLGRNSERRPENKPFVQTQSGAVQSFESLVEARVAAELDQDADLAAALSVSDTADLLGVPYGVVQNKLDNGDLYAYPVESASEERLIPRWQFHADLEVPHLGQVLHALPGGFTPLETKAFVTYAQIDHPSKPQQLGLFEYLIAGHDPSAAVAAAQEQQYEL